MTRPRRADDPQMAHAPAMAEAASPGGPPPDPAAVDRLADALVRLLAGWWQRHGDEPPVDRAR